LSWIPHEVQYLTRIFAARGGIKLGIGQAQVGMVEDIEELRAKFQFETLRKPETLEQ
jgi:hypothetical protein